MGMRSGVVSFAEVAGRIPGPAGEHFALGVERGTMTARLALGKFAPRPNRQQPHAQDELYVVVRGHGVLFHDGRFTSFAAGDLLFVAAGTEHHFEEFSDDLAVWIVFYGEEDDNTERLSSDSLVLPISGQGNPYS